MIQIKTQGGHLDLPAGFSIGIEDTNPIFNEIGSQSIPATVPVTRRNTALLGAPHRLDAGIDPNCPGKEVEVVDGAYIRRGIMNITEAGRSEGITFNVGFDNSTAYSEWSNSKLSELSGLPVYKPEEQPSGYHIDWLLQELMTVASTADPRKYDIAVFPLAISCETDGEGENTKTYWEILNLSGADGFSQPGKVKRIVDGEVTEVTVPEGYCISPFVKVWRILEFIFAALGLRLLSNPIKEDDNLCRLVVLNNAADSCCRGMIRYSDLMPDCTIGEFMNALWVRFGLVYNIDRTSSTVSIRLLRDILNQKVAVPLDTYAAGYEKIVYEARQFLTLSAKDSVEGASPATERFEDFSKGLDLSKIYHKVHVNDGENSIPGWPGKSGSFLAHEFITGNWFRLDSTNGKVMASSSGFFTWDPATTGASAVDLSSDDEWIPVKRISNVDTGTGHPFNDFCPLYLFGARHYHSYIKGNENPEESGDETPLAFMLAYTSGGKTLGRFSPEGPDGLTLHLDDGSTPNLSLLFQFKDGLFARYWQYYDEILRHGNRTVKVRMRINKLRLFSLDLFDVYTFKGCRCLIDTMYYSLPSDQDADVELTLRTIQTHGSYDIRTEQNIPDFSAANRHLEWSLVSDTFEDGLVDNAVRAEAARRYCRQESYNPHGETGDYWFIDFRSAVVDGISRIGTVWQTDPELRTPYAQYDRIYRNYNARADFRIFEIHDTAIDPDDDSSWTLAATPHGSITLDLTYTVELEGVWVDD